MSDSTSLETGPPRSADYMRRLELAMGRIKDAGRRLSPRDCVGVRNTALCEALDETPAQATRASRSSSMS